MQAETRETASVRHSVRLMFYATTKHQQLEAVLDGRGLAQLSELRYYIGLA